MNTSAIKQNTPVELQQPNVEFNSIISLNYISGDWTSENQEYTKDIVLEISNLSDFSIQFPPDWGLYMYVFDFQAEEWTELVSRAIITSEDPLVLLPKNDNNYTPRYFNIFPIFPEELGQRDPLYLRVIVIGEALGKNGSQDIGAATDVVIQP